MTVLLLAGIASVVTFFDPRQIWRVGFVLGLLCLAASVAMHG